MKKLSYYLLACTLLCAACSGDRAENDYTGAFADYVAESTGDDVKGAENITTVVVRDITVGDSIDYITHSLTQEYLTQLAEKKALWEAKQKDCETDEKANILRRAEHMKKYEQLKRKHGNDIKYQSKIEGYKKAADRLPANHEEYVAFDRRRSYSFTRDCEELKADYDAFNALGVEGYAADAPKILRYAGVDPAKVVATVVEVGYTQPEREATTVQYLFGHEPLRVISIFDSEIPNILDYKVESPAPVEEIK